MKQRRRDFSLRERRLIDGFIEEICRILQLPIKNDDLRQCGWEAFLSVYRDIPFAFSSGNLSGWRRAYHIIWDALEQERRHMQFSYYQQVSLDLPVSDDVPMTRAELLQSPHGDFQNSVCFFDYLERMGPDVSKMAHSLIHGCSMEEIRGYYRWSRPHTYHTFNCLRAGILEYLRI